MLPIPASSTNPNASSNGFDPSALISAGLDVTLGLIMAAKSQKDIKDLQNQISKLSKKQLADLEKKLKESKDQNERLSIFYKTLAVYANQKQIDELNSKKALGITLLGLTLLGVISLIVIKKTYIK